MIVQYTIRLDELNPTDGDKLKKWLNKWKFNGIVRWLIFHEIADKTQKPHFQGMIEIDTDLVSEDTHKERFRQEFKNTHPGGYRASAKVKKIEYLTYITKDNDLRYCQGFTPEEIDDLYKTSYKKSKKTFKKRFSTDSASPFNIFLIDEFRKHYLIMFPDTEVIDDIPQNMAFNDADLIDFLLDIYEERKKNINKWTIEAQVRMLNNSVRTGDAKQLWRDNFKAELLGNRYNEERY